MNVVLIKSCHMADETSHATEAGTGVQAPAALNMHFILDQQESLLRTRGYLCHLHASFSCWSLLRLLTRAPITANYNVLISEYLPAKNWTVRRPTQSTQANKHLSDNYFWLIITCSKLTRDPEMTYYIWDLLNHLVSPKRYKYKIYLHKLAETEINAC